MTRTMKSRVQTIRMRAALGLARCEIAAERALIVECNSKLDKAGRPRPGTLERAAARHVARLDRLLETIDRALGKRRAA